MREEVQKEGSNTNMMSLDNLQMPHVPDVRVNSIKPDGCFVFSSHVQPMALTFNATDGSEVNTVFKFGDDVRQDQMVL